MSEEWNKFPIWKALFFILSAFVGLLTTVMGFYGSKLLDLNDRIIFIEGSGCDNDYCSRLDRAIADVKGKTERFPPEIPPQWFRDKVSQNTQRISILEREASLNREAIREQEKRLSK